MNFRMISARMLHSIAESMAIREAELRRGRSQAGAWERERRRERVKLANLANFQTSKTHENRELGQLCQLFLRMRIERNRHSDEIGRVNDGNVG